MDGRSAIDETTDEDLAEVCQSKGTATEDAEGPSIGDELGHLDYEIISLRSVLADVMQVVNSIAPGTLDRHLSLARLRLQDIEHGRRPPAFETEDLVLRHRIDLFERGLGRVAPQG